MGNLNTMSERKYIVSFDQGTTSSRTMLIDRELQIISSSQIQVNQIYPKPGWVEHDPIQLFESQIESFKESLHKSKTNISSIKAIGITNQRETTIVWNKHTGKPIYNAIVWQCRRTKGICDALKKQGFENYIKENTGLVLDPYFSGTKLKWVLDHIDGARAQAEKGDLLFGTVDTWLVWKLTGGKVHVTDYTNASRTMLFNINNMSWDNNILRKFEIPGAMLPKVQKSISIYGYTDIFDGNQIPISGMAGDQQAALFGQMCVHEGQIKNTYGTGCFVLMNTGMNKISSKNGLVTTLACGEDGTPNYALEGSVFMGGASVQWLRDELKILKDVKDSEICANRVSSSNGVYLVPAFTGLGAPYWDSGGRGTILGLTRNSNADHIIRATLESIAFQCKDVIDAMEVDSNMKIQRLTVDGGAVSNNFLMQFQADLLNISVERPKEIEVTALGAAFLAGLAIGFWKSLEELKEKIKLDKSFRPDSRSKETQSLYKGWLRAVKCVQYWSDLEK